MSFNQKKKLMPKSALLVKKYRRPIRAAFLSLVAALCLLFLLRGPSSGEYSIPAEAGTSRAPGERVMPHADIVQGVHYPKNDGKKEKAAFVTLARNKDLWDLVRSIRHIEDRFNRKFHYDWVFLNDVPFDEEFIRITTSLVSGKTKYGVIPVEHWSVPDWIDEKKFQEVREQMVKDHVMYGDVVSYRHMCRYESGFFWQHELLDDYEWYWRVEPEIEIFCDIDYDVFRFMKENGKKYGFILSLSEYENTIPTLWDTTKKFMENYPQHINKNNLMDFVSDDGGEHYNMCHFWSNFEIGSLEFWRSKAYRDYFNYLDKAGGFFYERWGDAPVHSIAASLFLDRNELHFFDGIGYYHPDFTACPVEENIRTQNKCLCNPAKDHTWYTYYFCTRKYFAAKGLSLPPGVEPA